MRMSRVEITLTKTVLMSVLHFGLVAVFVSPLQGDVFEWEFIDPLKPELGKQASSTLAIDGEGADLNNLNDLTGRNLTKGYLAGADLSDFNVSTTILSSAYLADANLSHLQGDGLIAENADLTNSNLQAARLVNSNLEGADLTDTHLGGAWLDDASLRNVDFEDAVIRRAHFSRTTAKGFQAAQLYSTRSYRFKDLGYVFLDGNDLSNWDFSDVLLEHASFSSSSLVNAILNRANFSSAQLLGADFTDAEVVGANFNRSDLTASQLESTHSYKNKHLGGINLSGSNFSGLSFADLDLTNADLSGADLTGSNFANAIIRGVNFDNTTIDTPFVDVLKSTASYQQRDLSSVDFSHQDLSDLNLVGQDLRGAKFGYANLDSTRFEGANVQGVNFGYRFYEGMPTDPTLSEQQLYSTASYQQHDLRGIKFFRSNIDLEGWDFSDQNLIGATFGRSLPFPIAMNLDRADLRGSFDDSYFRNLTFNNTIRKDGRIHQLSLSNGQRMYIRNYEPVYREESLPIRDPHGILVLDRFQLTRGATLEVVFTEEPWNSTISFEGISVMLLGGTLELSFAEGVNVFEQVGRTFKLFDWTGVTTVGGFKFASEPQLIWDTSQLQSLGTVQLISVVPEPSTTILLALSALVLCGGRQNTAAKSST